MPDPDNDKKQATVEQAYSFELIQAELEQVRQRIESLLCAPDEQIRRCLEYLMERSGKMIRPALVLLSGRCFGPLQPEHIDLAAMVELVHRASLLHDDVIDCAQIRRDKSTANALWGNTAAVLLGDFLLSRAFYLGTSLQMRQAANILSQTAYDLCCGELRQNFCKGQWDLSLKQYYQIIEAKTAALFQSSCRLGAIGSGAAEQQTEMLSRFGLDLGMAFQMTDDLLDIVGIPEEAGKTLGTDLMQGKLTLPVIHWIGQDPAQKQGRIAQLEKGDQVQVLIQQMTDSGSMDYAMVQVQDRIVRAKQCLEGLPQSPAKEALMVLADDVANRLK